MEFEVNIGKTTITIPENQIQRKAKAAIYEYMKQESKELLEKHIANVKRIITQKIESLLCGYDFHRAVEDAIRNCVKDEIGHFFWNGRWIKPDDFEFSPEAYMKLGMAAEITGQLMKDNDDRFNIFPGGFCAFGDRGHDQGVRVAV